MQQRSITASHPYDGLRIFQRSHQRPSQRTCTRYKHWYSICNALTIPGYFPSELTFGTSDDDNKSSWPLDEFQKEMKRVGAQIKRPGTEQEMAMVRDLSFDSVDTDSHRQFSQSQPMDTCMANSLLLKVECCFVIRPPCDHPKLSIHGIKNLLMQHDSALVIGRMLSSEQLRIDSLGFSFICMPTQPLRD